MYQSSYEAPPRPRDPAPALEAATGWEEAEEDVFRRVR
jgi:hypothetical protein